MRILVTLIIVSMSGAVVGQEADASKWMHTEQGYTGAAGHRVRIQNSYPKGGAVYTDPAGKKYSYVIFWFRLFNESGSPAALTMQFPPEPYAIFPSPESHIRLFLPPAPMSADKIPLLDYGLTNISALLDAGLGKPCLWQRTIPANGETIFYVQVLFHQVSGSTRAALVLQGESLFLKINIHPVLKDQLLPCGKLIF